jgi:hypothetical protein
VDNLPRLRFLFRQFLFEFLLEFFFSRLTGFVQPGWGMGKRKTKKQSAKATLAEVVKEMAKPRVAMSAREQDHISRNEVLVVENDVEK